MQFYSAIPSQQSSQYINSQLLQINDIHQTLKFLSQLDKKIIIQWIPAHCRIEGNELADMLAKKGTQQIVRFLFIQQNLY